MASKQTKSHLFAIIKKPPRLQTGGLIYKKNKNY